MITTRGTQKYRSLRLRDAVETEVELVRHLRVYEVDWEREVSKYKIRTLFGPNPWGGRRSYANLCRLVAEVRARLPHLEVVSLNFDPRFMGLVHLVSEVMVWEPKDGEVLDQERVWLCRDGFGRAKLTSLEPDVFRRMDNQPEATTLSLSVVYGKNDGVAYRFLKSMVSLSRFNKVHLSLRSRRRGHFPINLLLDTLVGHMVNTPGKAWDLDVTYDSGCGSISYCGQTTPGLAIEERDSLLRFRVVDDGKVSLHPPHLCFHFRSWK